MVIFFTIVQATMSYTCSSSCHTIHSNSKHMHIDISSTQSQLMPQSCTNIPTWGTNRTYNHNMIIKRLINASPQWDPDLAFNSISDIHTSFIQLHLVPFIYTHIMTSHSICQLSPSHIIKHTIHTSLGAKIGEPLTWLSCQPWPWCDLSSLESPWVLSS